MRPTVACQKVQQRQALHHSPGKAKGERLEPSPSIRRSTSPLHQDQSIAAAAVMCTSTSTPLPDCLCTGPSVAKIRRCHMQKQKQQYGPAAGGAINLSPELEAAYQQFGRALGEAPRETARIVQAKLGQEQEQTGKRSAPQAAARQSRSPTQRCATEQACQGTS